jgi:Xaa-Pro dipeptidase
METMQPTLKRGRDVWDRINMPKTEFLERVEKIREQIQRKGIDLLLLYGNSLNEYGNPCYISNYFMKMAQGAVVAITCKGEVSLICEGFSRDLPTVKSTTWVDDVRSCEDVSQRSVAFLKEKNLIPSTIGFVGLEEFMPYHQFQFLLKSIEPCEIIRADDMIKEMRMIKSQREVDQIRRSSRIVTRIFDRIAHTPFPDVNEKNLEAVMGREAYLEGVEDVRMLIARPQEGNWALRPFEDVSLSADNGVIIYLAIEFERYWSEGIRTFLFKNGSFAEPNLKVVKLLYNRIMDGMRLGKRVFDFYKETIDKIKESQVDIIHEYGLGQGIGLSLQEFPLLSEEDAGFLKEGMCFTLRLAIKDKETGAMMIGDTIYLSKNGPEVLTKE